MPSELYYPNGASSLNPDTFKSNVLGGASTTTVWTPASGKSIVLFGYCLSGSTSVAGATFLVGRNSTDLFMHYAASQQVINVTFENGLRIFAPNDTIRIRMIQPMTFSYMLWGTEI